MNQSERQAALARHVDAVGACSYQELAALFGVSEMTIRRDADKLVGRSGLIKTLGGVQTAHAPQHLYESPVQQRLPIQRQEKEQIAREAMRQVKPQQTVFLDGSTTCLVLARHLAGASVGLTVVSHSALVCLEFGAGSPDVVVGLGGQFDPATACFVGPAAEEAARRYFVDVAFLSTKGFLRRRGPSSRRSPRSASSRSSRSRPRGWCCWWTTRSSASARCARCSTWRRSTK